MEEILASIRRIISEEEGVANGTVLDLTQTADGPTADELLVFEPETPSKRAPVRAEPGRAEPVRAEPVRPPAQIAPSAVAETIVSQPAAEAASGALTRLAGALRVAEQPNQTLEGIVRELLNPMLKEWLDRHLPAIVEAKVEAELERIARQAR